MMLSREQIERFYAFMRERESIRLKKEAGEPWPWTKDKVLQTYSFTNVKRYHDKTSRLLIAEFYKPNFNAPREQLLLNCAIARYFGTIEFMRSLQWQTTFRPTYIKAMATRVPKVFTGAYIITSGGISGPKEDYVVDHVLAPLWKSRHMLCRPWENWKPFIETLQTLPGFGGSGFMAKEVTLDTRYTSFWPKGTPKDVNTWTPIGPGSMRGANRVRGKTDKSKAEPYDTLEICKSLFAARHIHWPKDYVKLELHDIQFQLCEYDKWQRVKLDQGKPRRKYEHTLASKQGELFA